MRAIQIAKTGGPEVLELVDRELPEPGVGEVRVRHTAIGVNYIDTYHRSGLYPLASLPHGIGMEAAGVIEAVGPASDLPVGMRVAYIHGPPGAYAEARNYRADKLVRIPDQVGDEAAAAVLLKGMTVEYLIHRTFAVQPGMHVLFHAIAGGVGLIACRWLKQLGAIVIGTVSTEEKAALATESGCDHVIVTGRDDAGRAKIADRVKELTHGEGVPVVYDSIGRDTFDLSLSCLRRRGILVGFGNASGPPAPFDPMRLARGGSLYYTRATLFDYVATREELEASAAAVFARVVDKTITPHVGQRFALEDARACHEALEGRRTVGSTILDP
ncbi:MAG: quinone oxidoreductase [Sandaracinaceae bacterium]